MGNQWGDIYMYLCVPPTKMLGDVSSLPPIIGAPGLTYFETKVSANNSSC